MTEEIIIDKEEFWGMFEQHPINAVEGLFSKIETIVNLIARLEQENKELQAYKDINEDFKKAWDELNEKYKQLRSALEEIKNDIMSKKAVCTECIKIAKRIGEVLNNET